MANLTISNKGKRAYVLTHIDGTPLKAGNSVSLVSGNPTVLTVVPDTTPQVVGALQTGFLVSADNAPDTPGVALNYSESDANGVVVDSGAAQVDILTPVVAAPNLALALGPEVPKP